MFQKNEFKAVLALREMSVEDVSKAIGITTPAFYRKMNGQSDFYRHDIEKISKLLNLTSEEILKIFFT